VLALDLQGNVRIGRNWEKKRERERETERHRDEEREK
jgi:hypothetical protein